MRSRVPVLLLLVLACVAARGDDWNKSYTVSARPELHVIANDANLRVVSWERSQIAVHVSTIGWRIAPDELRITEQQAGNRVDVELRTPHDGLTFGRRSITVEISVPRQLALDLHTGDGHIDVRDVGGDLRLTSGDGHITGAGLDGMLRVQTGDGHIRLDGRFDQVEIETGDGHIEAEAAPGSKIGPGWRIHTGDGNVNLRLPDDFSADLDAHTGDGHITLDLPVTVAGALRPNQVRGKLNGGGATLTIRTGDGSIRLARGGAGTM